jgi:hypothetical protein
MRTKFVRKADGKELGRSRRRQEVNIGICQKIRYERVDWIRFAEGGSSGWFL